MYNEIGRKLNNIEETYMAKFDLIKYIPFLEVIGVLDDSSKNQEELTD